MKNLLFLLSFIFCCCINTSAQQNTLNARFGGNDGICLFEDGQFLLYGYATAVFGRYTVDQGKISFYPDRRELFEVFGHQNPDISPGETRVNYVGFEEGATFAQYNADSVRRVFNEAANCFAGPFVHSAGVTIDSLQLMEIGDEEEHAGLAVWHFHKSEPFNDFVMIYRQLSREYRDFSGELREDRLILSNYGGAKGYAKQRDDRDWEEILLMKRQYEASRNFGDYLLANPHYTLFQPDLSGYRVDESTNRYLVADTTENFEFHKDNPYRDDRFLRKYIKIPVTKKLLDTADIKHLARKSIFYTTCEDEERAYRYGSE